jgi:uncharacterized membrane protein YgcG
MPSDPVHQFTEMKNLAHRLLQTLLRITTVIGAALLASGSSVSAEKLPNKADRYFCDAVGVVISLVSTSGFTGDGRTVAEETTEQGGGFEEKIQQLTSVIDPDPLMAMIKVGCVVLASFLALLAVRLMLDGRIRMGIATRAQNRSSGVGSFVAGLVIGEALSNNTRSDSASDSDGADDGTPDNPGSSSSSEFSGGGGDCGGGGASDSF